MKTAYIPPIPHLKDFGEGDFHLILSHLLDDPVYREHYKGQRDRGAWLLLDNSAHENGQGADAEKLMYQALDLDVQEVVVPDCLDDADATLEATISALETWNKMMKASVPLAQRVPHLRFMYVPQGENYERLVYCLDQLVKSHVYNARQQHLRLDFSVGISKDYERFKGGLMRFLDEEVAPMHYAFGKNGVDVQVHMLGWGRNLWELSKIARKHTFLRSTDSAKPFVYGLAGISLDPTKEPPAYPRRPADYFACEMAPAQAYISNINASIFTAMAAGEI